MFQGDGRNGSLYSFKTGHFLLLFSSLWSPFYQNFLLPLPWFPWPVWQTTQLWLSRNSWEGDFTELSVKWEPISPREGFPGSSDGRVCLQCWRPRFNSWVRKIPWRRKLQTTPVFLPGESNGWRSLVGSKQLDITEWLTLRPPRDTWWQRGG